MEIDPVLWTLTHNAWLVLQTISRARLRELLARPDFRARVAALLERRRLDRFDGSARLLRILVDRQLGAIDDDLVVAAPGRVLGLLQRARVIGVQEQGETELVTEGLDGRHGLAHSQEGSLALGHTDHHRHRQLSGGGRHRLERDQVGEVEVPDGDVAPLGGLQDFTQRAHGDASRKARKRRMRVFVELSWASVGSTSARSSGTIRAASVLPSSTPH
jgi:hypothetical protein